MPGRFRSNFAKLAILKAAFAVCSILFCATMGFGLGEQALIRTIQTQTMFIRRKATEEQLRAAAANAKAFFSNLTPAKKMELKKKNIHAVLVRTVRSRETSPGAKDVRMRYSLEGESLIDNYAYEFDMPLEGGTIAQAKGLEPEYVGQ
jgi:hypothetical protein